MATIVWLAPAAILLLAIITFIIILPAYTLILAVITILRAKWHTYKHKVPNVWQGINTSLFQGKVFHTRHRPVVHSFDYPLYFSVVDIDEASELFGNENVYPDDPQQFQRDKLDVRRGALWPISSLMLLRDIDHMKNGEGLITKNLSSSSSNVVHRVSMRERIFNLLFERTNGKVDLTKAELTESKRKVLLVTHLMYYGYCFNPVSLYFILRQPQTTTENDDANNNNCNTEDEIEAIVVEVSNTPWNEMSIYVLHPDSVDIIDHTVYPPKKKDSKKLSNDTTAVTKSSPNSITKYRYKWKKNFHVSPFMTMDHDYDWKFQVSNDCIKVEANMIRQLDSSNGNDDTTASSSIDAVATRTNGTNSKEEKKGKLYFTAGFEIHRTIHPTSIFPLQLARVISRFPIYCFIIQLWIHYEAIWLLVKGVEFIPHPEGSETGASKAIASVMRPIFGLLDVVDGWWRRLKKRGVDGEKNKAA